MQKMRAGMLTVVASAAVVVALCVAGSGFAKGGGTSSGGSKGAGSAPTKPAAKKTIVEVMAEDTSLSKFAAAVKAADLETTLKGAGPYTLLAPNDAAFGKVDAAKLTDLQKPENKAKWKALLEAHIVKGKMKEADIAKQTKLAGEGGASHEVKVGDDKKPVIGGAKIVKADVEGSNGYIQIIDTVLMPAEKPAEKPPEGGK